MSKSSDLVALVKDPKFAKLFSQMINTPLEFDIFKNLEIPDGYDAEDLFTFFLTLRKYAAESSYIPLVLPSVRWATASNFILSHLFMLYKLGGSETKLEKTLQRRDCFEYIPDAKARDIQAALMRDDIPIEKTDLLAVLEKRREPSSSAELFALNLRTLEYEIRETLDVSLSSDYIDDLVIRLAKGTDGKKRSEIERPLPSDGTKYYTDPEKAKAYVLKAFNMAEITPLEAIAICVGNSTNCYYYQPFGNNTGMIEYLLRQHFFLRNNLYAFTYIPISEIHLYYNKQREELEKLGLNRGGESDWSPYLEAMLSKMEFCMHELGEEMEIFSERNSLLLDQVKQNTGFSYRQMETIEAALYNRHLQITISEYRKKYAISNGTARNDLFGLYQHGFLTSFNKGRQIVFKPVSYIESLIEETDWKRFRYVKSASASQSININTQKI